MFRILFAEIDGFSRRDRRFARWTMENEKAPVRRLGMLADP